LKEQSLRHGALLLNLWRELPGTSQAKAVERTAVFLERLVNVAKLQMLLARQSMETREPR
jgi:hypothetical protein